MKMPLNLLWFAMMEVLEDITLGNILAMNIYQIVFYFNLYEGKPCYLLNHIALK